MRTLPLTTEYTWYLKRDNFDVTMDLARHDFNACLRAGIPFIPVSHVSPIHQCESDCGFEMYRRLLDFAREDAAANGQELRTINLQDTCELV
jgi:hypothetical protein